MTAREILALSGEIFTLIAMVIGVITAITKVINGQKCLLRSEMLRIYYHNINERTIRQYELENFIKLYEAYKKMHGNSFIDKVYEDVMEWTVIT